MFFFYLCTVLGAGPLIMSHRDDGEALVLDMKEEVHTEDKCRENNCVGGCLTFEPGADMTRGSCDHVSKGVCINFRLKKKEGMWCEEGEAEFAQHEAVAAPKAAEETPASPPTTLATEADVSASNCQQENGEKCILGCLIRKDESWQCLGMGAYVCNRDGGVVCKDEPKKAVEPSVEMICCNWAAQNKCYIGITTRQDCDAKAQVDPDIKVIKDKYTAIPGRICNKWDAKCCDPSTHSSKKFCEV
mmetsp:Transcript_17720/g.30999  ORF Transcript_17720/g.30999 Transcript_17720/m.30999 type:complete len:245 (+) Transcript_17720:39-773(+)